jgi:hypothetical protein
LVSGEPPSKTCREIEIEKSPDSDRTPILPKRNRRQEKLNRTVVIAALFKVFLQDQLEENSGRWMPPQSQGVFIRVLSSSAASVLWYPSAHTKEWFAGRGESSQAFVGWYTTINVPNGWMYSNDDYGYTLGILFSSWMNEYPLEDCMAAAADKKLAFPLDSHYTIFGDPTLTRLPVFEP